ncbi:MAG: hydrolase 1, exosortase A system-associated [Gammaproteobacteria bacterium]
MNTPGPSLERVVSFACEGETLVGILHAAAASATRGVLIIVGGPQYRVGSHRQFVLLARDLARRGIPVLRFDYRGMGDSDGDFRGFEDVSADIAAAMAAFRAASPGLREIVLWGLCDGATAAAFFAAAHPKAIAGLIVANPWVRTEQGLARSYVRNYYGQRLFQWSFWRKLLRGEMQVWKTLRGFLADVEKARDTSGEQPVAALPERMRRAFDAFHGPVLLVLSGRDLTAGEFVACASQPGWIPILGRSGNRRLDLPEADHTFSRRRWQDEMSAACADWLRSW